MNTGNYYYKLFNTNRNTLVCVLCILLSANVFAQSQQEIQIANEYLLKGEKEKAIEKYKKFLDIWQEADKRLPELVDAKACLAKLSAGK